MNNTFAMSANYEQEYRKQAYLITLGFVVLAVLVMFLLRWKLPVQELVVNDPGIEVEMNLPPDPPVQQLAADDGGGGGGNPVQAAGPAGIANYAPPSAGEDSRDVEENDDKTSPEISKPVVVKPTATAVTNTTSPKAAEPKPVVETPAPRVAKATMGKQTTGTGRGGGADDYDRPGGSGNGSGVGNGNGNGGGSGNGNGGGKGTGSGPGSGPKITNGDRKIVRYYSFEGDLDKATIYANVNVSPEGVGKFVSIAKGSSNSNNAYKTAIMQYLQNIRFDKSDHESMVTVRFNFEVN